LQESKAGIGSRNIQYIVKKAENKWWSRLIKQTGKPPVFLTVDWDKWIDEDEEFTSKG
jgi:prostaglandin-E synthase